MAQEWPEDARRCGGARELRGGSCGHADALTDAQLGRYRLRRPHSAQEQVAQLDAVGVSKRDKCRKRYARSAALDALEMLRVQRRLLGRSPLRQLAALTDA